ncbi:MAG: extracellular solute-binding protein [Pontiellaceae bacterium]|nr:extracellular solute-binding protein [Pontiellaceae bacterium]MBN2783299.1 extracellular solute-binding protein [Pontiellaceae bacterium]
MSASWMKEIYSKAGGILLGVGVLGILLAGCSEGTVDAPINPAFIAGHQAPSPKHPLRWMGHWKGEGKREQLVLEVLEEFCYTHPQIDVSFRFASDILPEKSQQAAGEYIAEMIRSGNYQWDVIWMDPLIYHHVAMELDDREWGKKYLVDFSEIPGFTERHVASLIEGEYTSRYTGGICTGPYIEGFYYALWYNRDLLGKLGISLDEEQVDESDLLKCIAKLGQYNRQQERPASLLVDFENAGSVSRFLVSLKCSLSDCPEGGEAVTVSNRLISLIEQMSEAAQPDCPLVLEADSWSEAARALIDGQALFFCDATWRYNAFESLDPEGLKKLGLAPPPEFSDGCRHAIRGYISTWAVLKDAPGCDEGISLMEYWSRPSIAEKWIRYTKSPTGLKGSLYDPLYGKDAFADYQRRLVTQHRHALLDPLLFRDEVMDEEFELLEYAEHLLLGKVPDTEAQ